MPAIIKKQNKTKQSTSCHGLQLDRLEKKYSMIMGIWSFHRAFYAILVKDRNTGHVITWMSEYIAGWTYILKE